MISAAELKQALRIDDLEDAYEEEAQVARLEDLEAAAVAFVERRTGRYFGPPATEPAVVVVPGSGARTLYLPDYASAVTAVSSRAYLGGEETAIEPEADDGWALSLAPGRTHGLTLERAGGGVWSAGLQYLVSATVGYDAGQEPPEIREAVVKLVAHWWEQETPVAVGTVAPEVSLHVRDMLAPWKSLPL